MRNSRQYSIDAIGVDGRIHARGNRLSPADCGVKTEARKPSLEDEDTRGFCSRCWEDVD